MKRLKDFKISEEQLKNLTFSKMMIEETLTLMNFLIQKRVINSNIEIECFREQISSIKNLIELVLRDYGDKEITEMTLKEVKQISDVELFDEMLEKKKITNKTIAKKHREILKNNMSQLFDILKKIQLEDIAIEYRVNIYPLQEIEQIYKYM